jgi:hypothetical protein
MNGSPRWSGLSLSDGCTMPPNSRKISHLEYLLGGGVPMHRPLAEWSEVDVLRFATDPALCAGLSDADLADLLVQAEDMARAAGIDPGTIKAADLSLSSTSAEYNEHGREPMALTCGCGPCERYHEGRS